ncbi:sulfatase, partial [Streptomyces rubiginosohelvolus]
PYDGEITERHLLVRDHAHRAAALAEPMPTPEDLPNGGLLERPVLELLRDPALRTAVEDHLPDVTHTELIAFPAQSTLLDLARSGVIPTSTLRSLAACLQDL